MDHHTVTIYTTPTCSWCQAVKEYLRSRGIPFEEVDVSSDINRARELVAKTGQYGVPVIDIDGEFIVGFDRPRIDALLAPP
jgi:glutaredoxin-like YruB-family protein